MILPLLFHVITILPLISSSSCVRTCGEHKVQYPFGFSDDCQIKLNCNTNTNSTTTTIQISDYSVQNLTADHILITVPPKCDRPIEKLQDLITANFAPTWRNGILLQNCTSQQLDDCVVPTTLTASVPFLQGCDANSNSNSNSSSALRCYSSRGGSGFMVYDDVASRGGCKVMYSSITVDFGDSNGNESSSISLELNTVEIGWWLYGVCDCDRNANCTVIDSGNGEESYRCKCREGFAGDGFAAGEGCRRVRRCGAHWYKSVKCRSTKLALLIGGIITGALLVVAAIFICHCLKKRSKTLKSRLSAKRLLSEAAGNSSVPFYPYKEIERATNAFSEKQRLGTGAYGTVYSGKLHNDEWVAIKKIRYRDSESVEQVKNEIKLLSSVSHPNLVRLLGCCIENGEQILVYEYMPNGTLSQHLQRERGSVLPWTTRLTIAAETARAISHLHTAMDPPIYHRDIKSSNILLDYNFNSKVADFGLSRFGMTVTDDSHISTAPQGTPGYVDPQYHQNFHLSDKSDVYSFGVVLVEIITAMKVVDFSRPHSEINLAALAIDKIGKGRIDDIVDPFLEPNRDAWTLSSVHKVAELAFRCLAFHRDMRPSMVEVADELEQIRVSGWAPMEENMYVGSSVASSCSSPYYGSEKSFKTPAPIKGGLSSRRLIGSQRAVEELSKTEEVKENSPVSVQDPWLSEESPPSTNTLLANIIR